MLAIIAKLTLRCNMGCAYCYENKRRADMSLEVINSLITKALEYNIAHPLEHPKEGPHPFAQFYWHGGEPLLVDPKVYEAILEREAPYKEKIFIRNGIQSNGTLLTKERARWLHERSLSVGFSIDGPREIYEANRFYANGASSFDEAMNGAHNYREVTGAKPCAIAVITRRSLGREAEILDFFDREFYSFRALPYFPTDADRDARFAPTPKEYGQFLINLFDVWYTSQREVEILNFMHAMGDLVADRNLDCCCQRSCTEALFAVEPNGDVLPCDRFTATPENKIGNIISDSIEELLDKKRQFGYGKREEALDEKCRTCRWLSMCYGGCVYNAYASYGKFTAPDHYCEAYSMFFDHLYETVGAELSAAEVKE